MDLVGIESLIKKDKSNNEWLIERLDDGIIITFKSDPSLLKEPYLNTMFFEGNDFDTYYRVRELITTNTTDYIWNQFKTASSLLEQMIKGAKAP